MLVTSNFVKSFYACRVPKCERSHSQHTVGGLKFGGNRDVKVCNRGVVGAANINIYLSTMDSSDSKRCSSTVCNGNAGSVASLSDPAEIVVVRHGETTWNASGKLQGHLDAELNEVGRQQARAVAHRLSKESKIRAVYSSDLKRAVETAEIIAQACDSLMVIQDPALRERHLGNLQGLVLREAATVKPKAYKAFMSPKSDQEIPGGGESLDQLHQRCTSFFEEIARRHRGERVVVVTHGGVLRELYKRGQSSSSSPPSFRGKILNASVNIFHLSSEGNEWIIKTWGDVSHLGETGFLGNAFGGSEKSG